MRKLLGCFAVITIICLAFASCQEVPGDEPHAPVTSFSVTEETVAAPSPSVDPLRELLSSMTTEEKVGQLFFARFPEDSDALEEIKQCRPGGYLLFGVNFESSTPSGIQKTLADCQAASSIPLLFGVDEEGGTVVRASKYPAFRPSPFASPQELFREGGMQAVADDAKEKSVFLKKLGFTVNFAPVCDVSTHQKDFMFVRSFGRDANQTAEYVRTVVSAMQGTGVAPVLKHFPGYGDNVDTHTGIAIDERSTNQFWAEDFLPFQAGIEAGAPAVLVSHNIVNCMDAEYPASLSKKVHEILRDDLGFTGVIMTDDLAMQAVSSYAGEQQVAVQAVLAGNDLLISSDLPAQYESVLSAVREGVISQQILDNAVLHVLWFKHALGLI